MDAELRKLIQAAMANQDRPSGKRGVWCLGDLKLRCRVDDVSGCWIWGGAFCARQGRTVVMPWSGRPTTLGTAVCLLVTGKRPERNTFWHPFKCHNPRCCYPWHRQPMSRKEVFTDLFGGKPRPADAAARAALARRAQAVVDDAAYAEIASSTERAAVLAQRYGVTASYIRQIRSRSKTRKTLCATWLGGLDQLSGGRS